MSGERELEKSGVLKALKPSKMELALRSVKPKKTVAKYKQKTNLKKNQKYNKKKGTA